MSCLQSQVQGKLCTVIFGGTSVLKTLINLLVNDFSQKRTKGQCIVRSCNQCKILVIQSTQSKIYLLAYTEQFLKFLQRCLSREHSVHIQNNCGFVFALVYAQQLCHWQFRCHHLRRSCAPLMPPSSAWLCFESEKGSRRRFLCSENVSFTPADDG